MAQPLGLDYPPNQRSLSVLQRAISFSQGEFSLILVRCNYKSLRQQVIDYLRNRNSLQVVILPPDATTFFGAIQAQVVTLPATLLIVGLEQVHNLAALLASANQIRDELRHRLPVPIVLWVNDLVLGQMTRLAPDFTNWAATPIPLTLASEDLQQLLADQVAIALAQDQTQLTGNLNSLERNYDLTEIHLACREIVNATGAGLLALPESLQADLALVLGNAAYAAQQVPEALQYYYQARDFWSKQSNWQRRGLVWLYLALCHSRLAEQQPEQRQNHWRTAADLLEQAIHYLSLAENYQLAARAISQQGEIWQYLQHWHSLQKSAQTSLELHTAWGNQMEMAQDYGFLAMVAIAQSRWDDAERMARQALQLLQQTDSSHVLNRQEPILEQLYSLFLVKAQHHLGLTIEAEQQLVAAMIKLPMALQTSDHQVDPQHYLDVLKQMRAIYFEQGCYLEAFRIKQQQLAIEQLYGWRAFIGARRLQPQPIYHRLEHQPEIAPEITHSGRQRDLQNLLGKLNRADYRLIIIHGQSGVGKSSLLYAGLLPALADRNLGDRLALGKIIQVYTDWVRELGNALGIEAAQLPEIYQKLRQFEREHYTTVLIFDQFEEFFFHNPDIKVHRQFFEFLRECLNISFVKVILALREDALHFLLESERLEIDPINNNILDRKIRYSLGNFSCADATAVLQNLTARADFALEPQLIQEIVRELAGDSQEVLPIELQIVGSQLQSENITTLAQYRRAGPKGRLVERFLEQTIQDCGPENQVLAWQILYSLTTEEALRPLKTKAELELELGIDQNKVELVLEILDKSGLVYLYQEMPTRYQLIHDYLVPFIRQKEDLKKRHQLEEYKQKHQSNQVKIEELELKLRTQQLEARLKDVELQKSLSDRAMNQALQRRLLEARLWGLGFLTAALVAAGFGVRSLWNETNTQIGATVAKADTLGLANRHFEALIESLAAARQLENTWGAKPETQIRVTIALQQSLTRVRERNRLEGHTDWVRSVVYSPDGKWLVSGSSDRTVKLWNSQGQWQRDLVGHGDAILSVAVSPDSRLIASASQDKTIKIWSLGDAAAPPQTLVGHTNTVSRVVFSPDGQFLASASWDQTVRIWTVSGQLVQTLTLPGSDNRILGLDFSGDTLVTASTDGQVRWWQRPWSATPTLVWQAPPAAKPEDRAVTSVRFSPDQQTMIATGASGRVWLWQRQDNWLPTPNRMWQASNDWVISAAFGQGIIATGSRDNTIQIWDQQGKLLDTYRGHGNLVIEVNFSPDGQTLASASGDSTIKLWQQSKTSKTHPQAVNSVHLSPNGQVLAAASRDGQVYLWQTRGELLTSLKSGNTNVNSVQFSPNGQWLATGSDDGLVRLWPIDGKAPRLLKGHDGAVLGVAFAPDGQLLASVGGDRTLRLWSASGESLQVLTSHEAGVNSVQFSTDGQWLATGSDDRTVKLWHRDGRLVRTLNTGNGNVNFVAFSPDGKILAAGNNKGVIRLWKINGQEIATLRGHNGAVNWLGFANDQLLVSVSEDKTIKFWSPQGELFGTLMGHNDSIFEGSWHGQTLATAGQDGLVRLWETNQASLTRQGCQWLADYLANLPSSPCPRQPSN